MKTTIALATMFVAGVLLAGPVAASSVYANWAHVQEIDYHANGSYYVVQFDAPSIDTEFCDANDFAVIKASSTEGVSTTDLDVDRLIEELHIAQVTGQQVRLWVNGCTTTEAATTRPKAYLSMVKP